MLLEHAVEKFASRHKNHPLFVTGSHFAVKGFQRMENMGRAFNPMRVGRKGGWGSVLGSGSVGK